MGFDAVAKWYSASATAEGGGQVPAVRPGVLANTCTPDGRKEKARVPLPQMTA